MSTNYTAEHPLRVAIVGGGIGGLSLAIGLLKYPHVDVQVYEAAHSFREIGAGVGIGPNAQQALEIIGPDAKAAFDKHATGNMWPEYAEIFSSYVVGEGDHEGELIHPQRNKLGFQSVHRAHFLDELVRSIPIQRAHFNKRVNSLEDQTDAPVIIHFNDGTDSTADAVIGADGLHSKVRVHLLGEESAKPVFAGSAVYRAIVPMEKAVEKLGEEYAQNCFFFCGYGKATLSYPIDHGTTLNVVIFDFEYKTWDHEEWVVNADREALRSNFKSWGGPPRALVELLLGSSDTPSIWAMWDDAPASTYTKDCVAVLGDAAHATTPYQGQGAGQAIEDACVLSALLGEVKKPRMIKNAFLAYDQVRRVRTQRVVSTSRETGRLISFRGEGIGDDLEKLREILSNRAHWLWNRDMAAQNKEALLLFEEGL